MTNILTEAERFKGWMRLQVLREQMEQNVPVQFSDGAPDPEPMGKMYFKRNEIYANVLKRIQDMAPHGVSSTQQFHDIIEQCIAAENKDLALEATLEQMSDIVLSINDIEREFRATPYTAIGLHQSDMLNEEPIGMGKNYEPREQLMSLFKANVIRLSPKGLSSLSKGEHNLGSRHTNSLKGRTRDRYQTTLVNVKEEMIKTLDMIERTLKMIPPEVFFASEVGLSV